MSDIQLSESMVDFSSNLWSVFDRKKIDMFAVKLQEHGGFNLLAFNKIGGSKAKAVLPSNQRRQETFHFYQQI